MKKTMVKVKSASFAVAVVVLIFGFSELPLNAQQSTESGKHQVFSANPFGLILELFNAEYERVISGTSTIGFGGSTLKNDHDIYPEPPILGTDEFGFPIYDWANEPDPITETDRYINFDVFWRFYPSGNPLVGWAFGAKLGITSVNDQTHLGYGFDLNRSWLLGPEENFYVGLGFGLKRLIGTTEADDLIPVIPTIRIANVGFIF
ncbi:MAG TPA: hypothetical protein EYO83_06550 [Gemmatimonadetes bacterium]|nr:hypothetical protein [Gemmatimonadota bacterium]